MRHSFSFFERITIVQSKTKIGIVELDKIIKNDEMKASIEALRAEKDSKLNQILKSNLPLVTFSGEFNERRKSKLIKHSGLICLDVDKIPNVNEVKDQLKEMDFVHYMFVSPSGNGLKIVIKINATNEEEHLRYFEGLRHYFQSLGIEIDKACKDVSRGCFLSYDPTAFYNKESITLNDEWLKNYFLIEDKKIEKSTKKTEGAKTKSVHSNEVIRKAVKRFMDAKVGERHSTLLKQANHLGYYINAKIFTYDECYKALENAILTKKESEDDIDIVNAKVTIKKGLLYGIENPKPINDIAINEKDYQFWFASEGKITIKSTSFYTFLNRNGFWGYKYDKHNKWIKIEDNIVNLIDKANIIEFMMEYIKKQPFDIGNNCTKIDLEETFRNKMSHLLSENQLIAMNGIQPNFLSDDGNTAHLCFENGVLKITAKETKLIEYKDIGGLIWESSIIKRKWDSANIKTEEYLKSDFLNFVKGVTGERHDKEWSRFESMKTIIGYLLHEYKNPSRAIAVILLDEEISDKPEGGTGKSLLLKALGYCRKTVTIDGKNFKFGRAFDFQSVDVDTKLLTFEDVNKGFHFERLFSVITEGITVERKGQQPFRIDSKDSPKIIISTNYTISGEGNSNERRRIEIEFSQFYNAVHTPLKDFGKMMFEDWTEIDWLYFDAFMVECIMLYLNKGLIRPKVRNIPLRKLMQETSDEFARYAQNELHKLENGKEYNKQTLFKRFKELYSVVELEVNLSQTEFNKWLRLYALLLGYHIKERISNNIPLVSFTKKE